MPRRQLSSNAVNAPNIEFTTRGRNTNLCITSSWKITSSRKSEKRYYHDTKEKKNAGQLRKLLLELRYNRGRNSICTQVSHKGNINLNLRTFLTKHRPTLPVTHESNFSDILLSTTQFFRGFYSRDPWTAQETFLKLTEKTWRENVLKSHFIRFDFQKNDPLCVQLGFCFVLYSFSCSSFQLPFILQNKGRGIKNKIKNH